MLPFDSYVTICHHLPILTIPITLFGAYSILFNTPPRMAALRPYMLYLHTWIFITDVTIALFVTPYLFIPVLGGFGNGILSLLGVHPLLQIYIIIILVGETSSAILFLFENLHRTLVKSRFVLKKKKFRRAFYTIHHCVSVFYSLPLILSVPDQEESKRKALQILSQPDERFFSNKVFIISDDSVKVAILLFSLVMFFVIESFFFVVHTTCSLTCLLDSSRFSVRTKILQRRLFISICIQVFVPLMVIVTPVVFLAFSQATCYYNQDFNNVCFIVLCLHGFFSTIATTLIYEPYRQNCFGRFREPNDESLKNNAVTVKTTVARLNL